MISGLFWVHYLLLSLHAKHNYQPAHYRMVVLPFPLLFCLLGSCYGLALALGARGDSVLGR